MLEKRSPIRAILVVLGLLATACGTPASPAPMPPAFPTYTPGPTRLPVTPEIITPAPSPMVGEQVIRYELQGGFGGLQLAMEIGPTGELRVTRFNELVTTTVMLPDRLTALQARFPAIHFFEFNNLYEDSSILISDDWYDSVTYTLNGQTKTVRVARLRGAHIIPLDLANLIYDLHQTMVSVASELP